MAARRIKSRLAKSSTKMETLKVNVFFQLIMLLFEAFAVIHLGDMEARYKELTKYYELTNYIANEREDF